MPYPTPGKAIGTAFAVPQTESIPASLSNIRKELFNTRGISFYMDIDDTKWRNLSHWNNQGILLLNTALTVESGNAGSHLDYWRTFTEKVIKYISYHQGCVWLLWGKKAQSFGRYINKSMKVQGYDRSTIKHIPDDN
jgi:uracil-DNA glycosylase